MKVSLFWRLFIPVASIMIVSLATLLWIVSQKISENTLTEAISQAEKTVNQFKTIRAYYTKNVISKVIAGSNLKPSFNHKNDKGKIPLPATMIHDLSELLEKNSTKIKLYSAYPFPNRKKSSSG